MPRPTELVLATSLLTAACGAPAPDQGPGGFVRPVVLAGHPLDLDNPQQDTVVWPIWGGAFTTDEPVDLRVTMTPGGADLNGLVIAGPGDPGSRVAVELLGGPTGWTLRETAGATIVQSQALVVTPSAALLVRITRDEIRVTTGEHAATLALSAPLADDGPAGLYVHLAAGGALELRELALTQPLPTRPDLGAPLRSLAAARDRLLGSAIDIWPPLHDLDFEALLAEQFNAAAPTELYWATTRGEDRDFFFVPADLSINYAIVHDQAITGMFLVWDFELPEWLLELAGSGDGEAVSEVFDEHIRHTVSRYRGEVDTWVVVNEAIWGPAETDGGPAEYAYNVWLDLLGPAYIERAFAVARLADPDAVLLYNETGAEAPGPKADFLYEMAADLVARDVPIDAIGLQFHVDAAAPPDLADVRANMERLAALGLDIYITELDVTIADTSAAQLELQAELYADIVGACLVVPACRNTTVFGFSDRYAWDELGDAAPLLFDASYAAKPAFHALQSALAM